MKTDDKTVVENYDELRATYSQIVRDFNTLSAAGLLNNHVHNYPDLYESIAKLVRPLHLDLCGTCMHPYTDHWLFYGRKKYCCDGCDEFDWSSPFKEKNGN